MAGVLRRNPSELSYALRWLHSVLPGHSPLHDQVPWITFRAIDWLDAYLKPDMCVFEYGAGGSTLYFVERAREVISVEHDKGFYQIVQEIISRHNRKSCELLLHEPTLCSESSRNFASHQERYKGQCFESYVKAIDRCPDKSLDLVLVDGRARLACVARALPKIRPGGALMLDNSERPDYAAAYKMMSALQRLDFPGLTPWNLDVSQTSVWRVPS